MLHSWLTAKAEIRPAGAKGLGVFATEPISAGETVTAFGGFAVHRSDFDRLSESHRRHSLQIDEELFLACPADAEPADHVNHSCDPNLEIAGSVMLIARRDIAAGEELTFDYAMCDADPYDEFECCCGAETCRRKVTGNDWMSPELQERYAGGFSTYLERRIAVLRAQPQRDHL